MGRGSPGHMGEMEAVHQGLSGWNTPSFNATSCWPWTRCRSFFSLGISSSQPFKHFLSFCAAFPSGVLLTGMNFLSLRFWQSVMDPSLISLGEIALSSLDAVCGAVYLGVLPSLSKGMWVCPLWNLNSEQSDKKTTRGWSSISLVTVSGWDRWAPLTQASILPLSSLVL